MRSLFFAVLMAVTLGMPPALAEETKDLITGPEDVDWTLLPDTVDGLQELNREQLRELRRFGNICGINVLRNLSRNTCVITGMDNYIRQDTSPEMQAFHFGMLPVMRYNENRTYVDMARFLSRRNSMAVRQAQE